MSGTLWICWILAAFIQPVYLDVDPGNGCQPGTFGTGNPVVCEDCPKGYYQPDSDQTECIKCDEFLTTVGTGSTAESDCSEEIRGCVDDYCCLGANDLCPARAPQIGDPNCFCDINCIATSDCCSDFGSECFPCDLGQFYNVADGQCEDCPVGTYRDASSLSCQTCSQAMFTTLSTGSTSASDCVFVCGGGEYVTMNAANNFVCMPCPQDTYKPDTTDFAVATECTACPDDSPRNLVTGSDTIDDCQYANCGQGQIYNPNNPLQCLECPAGTYQDKEYPLGFDECTDCPTGRSTADTGSSLILCVESCPSGEQFDIINQICEVCEINFYKDNSINAQGPYTTCVQCPDPGYRTLSTGATSVTDCNIISCNRGYYTDIANNVCVQCPADQYQNEDWQTECNDCPLGHGTRNGVLGANDITNCFRYCPDGEELVAEVCEPCAVGYYKNNADGRFQSCTACPDPEEITESTGSTSVSQCSIVNCTAGSYRVVESNTCELCARGTYQNLDYQTECMPCPQGTSSMMGAQDRSECIDVSTDTFLVGLLTTISCSANSAFKDNSSALYLSVSQRSFVTVRNIIDNDLTDITITARDVRFIGFRCFDDVINILLQIQVQRIDSDTSTLRSALQTVLSTAMSSGTLTDPEGLAADLSVSPDGITDNDIATSADLSCVPGEYTNLSTLTCIQCEKGYFQPLGAPELCYPCERGVTTAGTGANGLEEELCVIADPDDYVTHKFLVEIATTTDCTESFTNPTSGDYVSYSSDSQYIIRNVIMEEVDEQYRFNTPIVLFVGFRCNSPVEILLELTMTNLDLTDTATVTAVLAALNAEMADGMLSDPVGSLSGVIDIPVSTTTMAMVNTLSSENLNCPNGQQTDLVSGQCVECPIGTYQPENVPELCYPCPVDTTTSGTGTVLASGQDVTTVCPITVTEGILIPEGVTIPNVNPGCPAFLYNGVCVTACPTGYTANSNKICEEDEDTDEGSKTVRKEKTGATGLGIGIGAGFGGLFLALLFIFIACVCIKLSNTRAKESSYDKRRFLDSRSKTYRDRPLSRSAARASDIPGRDFYFY